MSAQPLCTVHWAKSWADKHVRSIDACHHEGDRVLTINQRLEPLGKGHRMAADAVICMDCGKDVLGRMSLVDGLDACMVEHGWNREAGLRLYDLAELHQNELRQERRVPIWMASAWGLTGRQIHAALNDSLPEPPEAGTLRP